MAENNRIIKFICDVKGERADVFVADEIEDAAAVPAVSRSGVKKLIDEGNVLVNGELQDKYWRCN